MPSLNCTLCGGTTFRQQPVLWPELIAQWQLGREEAAYIDDQQGCICCGCGASLRVAVLASALLEARGATGTLDQFCRTPQAQAIRILDVNGAAAISALLSDLPAYRRADYPAVDLHALPFEDGSFDLVIHSDTLEHVAQPVRALEECRRVLAPGGRLCFTVPVIVGRMSRSREGLAASHHGNPATAGDDLLVRTEFGADVWTYLMRAGFTRVLAHTLSYPAATAWSAW